MYDINKLRLNQVPWSQKWVTMLENSFIISFYFYMTKWYYINKNKLLFTNKTSHPHMTQPWISLKHLLSNASFFKHMYKNGHYNFFKNYNMPNFAFMSGNQRSSLTGLSLNYILCTSTLLTCVITIHKKMKSKNEYLYKGKKFYLRCFHDPVKALTYWVSTYTNFPHL